jgi:hypothetical protein
MSSLDSDPLLMIPLLMPRLLLLPRLKSPDAPTTEAPKLVAPSIPVEACVTQDEQHCSQPSAVGSEEWQTVIKRRNSNGNK